MSSNALSQLKQSINTLDGSQSVDNAFNTGTLSALPNNPFQGPAAAPAKKEPAPSPALEALTNDTSMAAGESFYPKMAEDFEDLGIPMVFMEGLVLKWILARGSITGQELANVLCVPYAIVNKLLHDFKAQMRVGHKCAAALGDFEYVLTDEGRQKALDAREESAYVGPLPVSIAEYIDSVHAQSIRNESPDEPRLRNAFSDLLINDDLFDTLGPAVSSGKGLFLFGEPGNGKTSIAERICRCYDANIYVPHCLLVDGQVIKFHDEQCHLPATSTHSNVDKRWVCVERPAVIVGGELVLESLDIQFNKTLNISEAPLQMKANGGIFLIDDFGRQQVQPEALLNRWIVPLEKRIDYLSLPNGQKLEVPFAAFIIFSTNLEPSQLVDDAFLRRIPYKIHIKNPREEEYKAIMKIMTKKYGIEFCDEAFKYLVDNHYTGKRPFRSCQPRDLLDQVVNMSNYHREPATMTPDSLDIACHNYFSAMGQ